jgi:iron complex outermembrane receptor protein
VEVLKGPGSVLFGQGSLGGVVNQVSRSPEAEPGYRFDLMGGSFGTFQGALDLNAPLSGDGAFSGRTIALYRHLGDSIDFNDKERIYLAPALRWTNGATDLIVRGNYTRDRHQGTYVGVPVEGSILPNPNGRIPRNRYIGEPGHDRVAIDRYQIGYQFEHRFSPALRLRQNLRFSDSDVLSAATFANALARDPTTGALVDGRTLSRGTAVFTQAEQATTIDTNLEWRADGRGFENLLLVGADLLFQKIDSQFDFGAFTAIDLFDPVYGGTRSPLAAVQDFVRKDDLYGIYLQNQLNIGERLTLLAGVRYDISRVDNRNRIGASRRQRDSDITFRAGAVYQVRPGIGFYASYAEAFNPNFGLDQQGEPFEAETGEQYEVGLKTDLDGGRIRTTLAAYQLTRDNVLVPFPGFPGLNVQTGQQRSRGIEADASVTLHPGWNVTAAYAYTDVFVRRDANPVLVGDRPINVPEHQASLWSTYDMRVGRGDLKLGAGIRIVGPREALLPNDYRVPGYEVFDAALGYQIDRWRFQVNAYNLFDRNYVDSASPTGQRSVLLGEPLTIRFGIGYSL